jgi:hypothetical protein
MPTPRSIVLVIALAVTACHAARAPTSTVGNDTGDGARPGYRADVSLRGPFARLADAPGFEHVGDAEAPAEVTVLGATDGTAKVALRQVRDTWTAASCMVTIETPDGVFVGHSFLCSANRSDEDVKTDQVSATITGDAAIVAFRVSYQIDQGTPDVKAYQIRCSLGATLSCTAPPAIGGYEDE